MTDKTIDEHKAELAKALQEAATQQQIPQGAQGAFGLPNIWGLVAGRLIDVIEEIVIDLIRAEQNKRSGS